MIEYCLPVDLEPEVLKFDSHGELAFREGVASSRPSRTLTTGLSIGDSQRPLFTLNVS
jgi:hypothetical protein